ncbi:MAG: hypothetical protein AMXMBFR37_09990 [Steroidobacteraceae bacterium]
MRHRLVRGKIRYLSKKPDSFDQLRGSESFCMTYHTDGRVVMRATCELELPSPKLLRDVVCGYDPQGRVENAYVHLVLEDRFLGAGWYRREGDELLLEAWSTESGRASQRVASDASIEDLGLHPVVSDGYICRKVDVRKGPHKRKVKLQAVSLDQRGATPPVIAPMEAVIAYLGDEQVTVAAGTFNTHHYQYLDAGAGTMATPYPPVDVWVTADGDYIYVKGRIGGNFMSEYELVEYEQCAAGA